MEDLLHYSVLYDLYKELLTEKQKRVFEDYFFENLTLDEIASNYGVSKNAISKSIKQIKTSLDGYEKNLHKKEYIDSLKEEFKSEEDILIRIAKYDNIMMS